MNSNELDNQAAKHFFCCMAKSSIPELGWLLHEVEEKYGGRLATSKDFDALSLAIQEQTRTVISSSTLKRLWGYVSLNPLPRRATLDILAKYLSFKDFPTYCESLSKRGISESGFFDSRSISVSDLQEGSRLEIGWAPNRLVTLLYLGNFLFEVIDSQNSKLEKGDRFELSNIIFGYPLFISRILRNGEYTPSFIAGRETGINTLKVL